jgi:hypothetical protein
MGAVTRLSVCTSLCCCIRFCKTISHDIANPVPTIRPGEPPTPPAPVTFAKTVCCDRLSRAGAKTSDQHRSSIEQKNRSMPERLLCFGTLAGLIPAAGNRLSRLPPHGYKTVSFPCNHGPVLKCTPRPTLLPGQANKVGIEIAFCTDSSFSCREGSGSSRRREQ